MYNICKCSSNLHQHIKIRIKNVPGDQDETCLPKLGLKMCTGGAVTHAGGTAERSERRAVGMGLKLVFCTLAQCQVPVTFFYWRLGHHWLHG